MSRPSDEIHTGSQSKIKSSSFCNCYGKRARAVFKFMKFGPGKRTPPPARTVTASEEAPRASVSLTE